MPKGIYQRTKEMGKNMSISRLKRKKRLGYLNSPEMRQKSSESQKGRIISEETKKKMRENNKRPMLDKKHSEEARKKMVGRKVSEETRKKLGKAFKGRKHSAETKLKMSKVRKGKYTREKHPNWQGGISFEPYVLEFNEDLREVIRNRDRRKCQICEKTELENKNKLDIHHINYNKQNTNPNNLITLCRNCHSKTNFKRDYWIKYFNEKFYCQKK